MVNLKVCFIVEIFGVDPGLSQGQMNQCIFLSAALTSVSNKCQSVLCSCILWYAGHCPPRRELAENLLELMWDCYVVYLIHSSWSGIVFRVCFSVYVWECVPVCISIHVWECARVCFSVNVWECVLGLFFCLLHMNESRCSVRRKSLKPIIKMSFIKGTHKSPNSPGTLTQFRHVIVEPLIFRLLGIKKTFFLFLFSFFFLRFTEMVKYLVYFF